MAPTAQTQFFAVLRDGQPVSTSLLYLADGLAGIYSVSTLPEERGKGFGAHATAEALRAAFTLGYRVGVLQFFRRRQLGLSPAGSRTWGRCGCLSACRSENRNCCDASSSGPATCAGRLHCACSVLEAQKLVGSDQFPGSERH